MQSTILCLIKIALIFSFFSCSSEAQMNETVIEGRLVVDPEIDETGNFSNFNLLIALRDTTGAYSDTVYHAITDQDGYFSGTARFKEKNLYPLLITRNNNNLGVVNIVLADGDSVRIEAEFPELEETLKIESAENNVLDTVERIDRNFNRVMRFISAGAVSEDSVGIELQKWSDIYWDLYNDNPDTYAGDRALSRSLAILEGWNDSMMIERIESVTSREKTLPASVRRLATNYYAETSGADRAVSYLDSLAKNANDNDIQMAIEMEMIKLLYDSASVELASQKIEDFKTSYTDHQRGQQWADRISYDIENFSAGDPIPSFEFTTTGNEVIDKDSLAGKPFILEFTRLDDPLYQDQYDRLLVISQIYQNFGLEVITVPLGATDVTLNAFFEERVKQWPFIDPNSLDVEDLRKRFNIYSIPVRFLVDEDGNLIRKYTGTEFDQIITGLQKIRTNQVENP
jgi:hypothetical protein